MDRQTQRQNIRNIEGSTCKADFALTPASLPAGRPVPGCETAASPQAFPFYSPTGCPLPLPDVVLSPSGLAISNDLQTAYCPTAVGYSSTGTIVFSVTAADQQTIVFFQTLEGITTQQLNYLYDAVPASSTAIITAALAGNTAQVKNLTKLNDTQATELIVQTQAAKFLVNTLAVDKARNSLNCQGYNEYQYASCTASAYFGPSAAVPPELPYSPTAFSATGAFTVPFTLKSTTGDQAAFTLLNIPGLTAATQLANELALASATRQLACVYQNDEQWASCCNTYPNNLGYDYCVPNDILPVLPALSPRVGVTGVATGYIFSAVSKSEANSLAADIARSLLNCYFPNEDSATSCSDNLVASPYPTNFSVNNATWSATANQLFIPFRQTYEVPLNTRLYFSGAAIPAGLTADEIYFATSITGYASGIAIKISSSTASHIEYETGTIPFITFSNSGSGGNVTVLKSSNPGRYAYILRGEVVQTDTSASTTSANALAASLLPTYLDCYWGNDAKSATCPDVSVTGINGLPYTIPASPSASRVYNVTIGANTIISYISKNDANASASAAAYLSLDCAYCNLRVDPVCTPTAGNLYPDEDLPLSASAYIPNCWSINATPGTPPGVICDTDAAAAQNLAISLGNISLRDQKAESTNCCYESQPVYNTIFCGTGAVYSDSSAAGALNSQDSFFLPSGTIVICATGEAPPAPVNRFLYTDVWLTNSMVGFCCTGATGVENCIPVNYNEYYLGNVWGDATQAFSTNAGTVKFYSTSGALTPLDFSAAGVQGFTAGYVARSIGGNIAYRNVLESGGLPTSDTRYISSCPTCLPELFEYNVHIANYSPNSGDTGLSYALNYALCNNYSGAPGSSVWVTSPSAFNSYADAVNASWYADACATTPLNLASSTAYSVVLKSTTSAVGSSKYAIFNAPGIFKPTSIVDSSYAGSSAYAVTGCYVPYAGASGIFAAVQNIFCAGPSAEAAVIYTNSASAFDLGSNYLENKWCSATCGLPSFTPNSGTAYVVGKYISGVGNVYLVFGSSGSSQVTSGALKTNGCYGLYPYFVYPSTQICDTTVAGLTLYANLNNAFTTNGAEQVYFYTEPYNAAAVYSASAGTYLSWVSNSLSVYSRITSGTPNLFEAAVSCDNTLVPVTVYYSNTAAADVCSFPWALSASGSSGYNSNIRTLYAKPYVFYSGGPTSAIFYTAANTGSSYIFNNGTTGQITYLAPYNYYANLNLYYREYINGGTGSTGLLSFDTNLHKLSPFQQSGNFVDDNIWEQWDKQSNASFGGTNYPAYTYSSLKIVSPSTGASCQTRALYSDVVDVFTPFSEYSSSTSNILSGSSSYHKLYSSGGAKRMLFNDGVLAHIGTCSYLTGSTINATSDRLGAVFPGCVLQTSPTSYILPTTYVSAVDTDTGVITLAGPGSNLFYSGFSTLASPVNFSVVGYSVEVDAYNDNATYLMSVTANADLNQGKWKIKSPTNLDTLVLSSNEGKLYSNTAAELYPPLGNTSLQAGDLISIRLDNGNFATRTINSFNNSQEAVLSSNIVSSASNYFLSATSAGNFDSATASTFTQIVSGLTANVSVSAISRAYTGVTWKRGYTGYYKNIKWDTNLNALILPIPLSQFSETEFEKIRIKINRNGAIVSSSDFNSLNNLLTFDGTTGPNLGNLNNASLFKNDDGFIYVTCPSGGASGLGSIVKFDSNGQNYSEVVDFSSQSSGISGYAPVGPLIKGHDGGLYGICADGGVNSSGMIYTLPLVANTYLRAGVPGTSGASNSPLTVTDVLGVATDTDNIYFSDHYYNTIRKMGLTASGTTAALLAGSPGVAGFINNSAGANARFNRPAGMAATGGFLYVADSANNVIRKINTTSGASETFCGASSGVAGTASGASGTARFSYPIDVAFGYNSGTASLFVADYSNNAIRAVTVAGSDTGYVNNYANSAVGTAGLAPTSVGTKGAARFRSPAGVAYDGTTGAGAGNVYVADTYNHRIVMLKPGGLTTANLAVHMAGGTGGLFDYGYVNGASGVARFTYPYAVQVLKDGDLLVGDIATIRRVSSTGYVTLVAGSASGVTGYANGVTAQARFDQIKRIISDPSDTSGNKFIVSEGIGVAVAGGHNSDLRTLWYQYGAPLQKFTQFGSATSSPKTPQAGLVWNTTANNYYGTTIEGGTNGAIPGSTTYFGTVYRCSVTGSISRILDFSGTAGTTPGRYPNALTLGPDGFLYGTTKFGGASDYGTVFRINSATSGGVSSYTTLIEFNGSTGATATSRGKYPEGNVIFDGASAYLYGIASGGIYDAGIIFRSGTATSAAGPTGAIYDFQDTPGVLNLGQQPSPCILWGPGDYLYGSMLKGNSGLFSTSTFRCTTAGALTKLYSNDGGADIVPRNFIFDSVSNKFFGAAANTYVGPFSSANTAADNTGTAYVYSAQEYSTTETAVVIKSSYTGSTATNIINTYTDNDSSGVNAYVEYLDSITVPLLDRTCANCITAGTEVVFSGSTGPVATGTTAYIKSVTGSSRTPASVGSSISVSLSYLGATATLNGSFTGATGPIFTLFGKTGLSPTGATSNFITNINGLNITFNEPVIAIAGSNFTLNRNLLGLTAYRQNPDAPFECSGPLCDKIEPGHFIYNSAATVVQAFVTSTSGGTINYKSIPATDDFYGTSTLDFGSYLASRVYVLGKYATQLWLDNDKGQSITGLYSELSTTGSNYKSTTTHSSFIYKDQTKIYHRAIQYPGFGTGNTAQNENIITFVNSYYDTPLFYTSAYPGGTAPNNFYDGSPVLTGNTGVYCAGGNYYQEAKIVDCNNNVSSSAWIQVTPASSGYILANCETGAGTAYVEITELNSGNTLYYWSDTCSGTGAAPLTLITKNDNLAYILPTLSSGYYFEDGVRSTPYASAHVYPCVPSAPSMAYFNDLAMQPMVYGMESMFDASMFESVGSSAGCDVYTEQQSDADRIAQELVNSFVRCYYINELQSYTTCPATGGNPEATIKLNDGIVNPGTFVSVISQDDANQIADSVAKSLLVCVTPDQVGGGANGPSNLNYSSMGRAYLKRIKICDPTTGTPEDVWVFKNTAEFINITEDDLQETIVYFAAYREDKGPPAPTTDTSNGRRNYALQKAGAGSTGASA